MSKIVWITGASSGIGAAMAQTYLRRGDRVILSARRADELKKVAEVTGVAQNNYAILPLDLTETSQAEEIVRKALSFFGQIDVLINNGGIGHLGSVIEMSLEVERKVMETNLWGHVALTKALLPSMLERNTGTIVIISSILGYFGSPRLAAYSASKHAVLGYYDSLRLELAGSKVNILTVAPGFINTEVTKRSLTADGMEYGKNSPAQEKGMEPMRFAAKLISAIDRRKTHVMIGGYETWSVPFWKISPSIFYRAMMFLSGKARKKHK